MKTLYLSIGLVSLIYLSTQDVYAQDVVSFKSEIQELKIEPLTGSVLVKTKDGISSLNPDTKETIWTIDVNKINNANAINRIAKSYEALQSNDFSKAFSSATDLDFIPNSPFIQIKFDQNSIIVNSTNGEVLFNAAESGYLIYTTSFIPLKKQLLILGQKDNNIDFINLDLSSKKINWTSNVGSLDNLAKEFTNFLGSLLKNEVALAENKVIVSNGNIFAGVKNLLFALDSNTGEIKWKTNYPINNFHISGNGERIITILNSGSLFSLKQKLNILDTSNGNKLWKDDITTKYISYLEDHEDKILIAHQAGFNFYDYATGNKLWKKDAKGKDIKQVISIDNDYLYIADNEMNLIDKDGQNKWKKFVEIADKSDDAVYYLGTVGNNRVFYLTDTYGNMVDYTSGKKIWKKNIEFDKKRPLVFDAKDDKFLVYNNKRIYTFNTNNEDSPKPKGKIDVENDKTIQSLESFDWGTVIVGQNDVIGLDNEGNTLYQKTYKEPGEAARRLLKTGGIIGKSFLGFKSGTNKGLASAEVVYKDKNGNEKSSYLVSQNDREKLLKKSSNLDGYSDIIDKNLLSKVNNRFNGLKQNNNFAFILSRGDNGPELVKVRKKDGQEVAKISLDSNKPIYDLDPITDNIYYASGKDLKIYK